MTTTYYRLSQQEIDEMRKLNIQEGIQRQKDNTLRFLRKVRDQELIIHSYKGLGCDCIDCVEIARLEKE